MAGRVVKLATHVSLKGILIRLAKAGEVDALLSVPGAQLQEQQAADEGGERELL